MKLPFDLTDLDNFASGFPHHLFVVHRRDAPVYWHEPTAHTPDGEGFWSVATYAETLRVLKDPETYSSERGGERACGGTLLQDLPIAGIVLNMMDGPATHASAAWSPPACRRGRWRASSPSCAVARAARSNRRWRRDRLPPRGGGGAAHAGHLHHARRAGGGSTHAARERRARVRLPRPAQLAALRAERRLLPTAIEEMLRWTTPSPSKRRTATRPTELGGHAIRPGDKVLFWEGSANRDERVFARGMEFDVRRDPNPHLAFGNGVHFCLGANLARLEMRVVFEELLATFARYTLSGPVEWTRSNRHTGIRHLPLRLTRAAR